MRDGLLRRRQSPVATWWHPVTHGRGSEGETGEWSGQPVLFTPPRNMVYPALLPLMRTHRLPVVDWTDAPADLNGLVRFAERQNLVSARVPSHFKRSVRHNMQVKKKKSRKRSFQGRTFWLLRPKFKRNAAFHSLQRSWFWEVTRKELNQPPTLTTFLWFFESWYQNVVNILSPFAKANVQIMNKEAFWIAYENNAATYKRDCDALCALTLHCSWQPFHRRPNDNIYKYVTSLLSFLNMKN